jgi:hypothetical protein
LSGSEEFGVSGVFRKMKCLFSIAPEVEKVVKAGGVS